MIIQEFVVLAGFMLAGGIGGLILSRTLRHRSVTAKLAVKARTLSVAETVPLAAVEPEEDPVREEEAPVAQAAGPADDGGTLTDAEPLDEPMAELDDEPQVDAAPDDEPAISTSDTAATLARMEYLLKHIAQAQLALNEHVTSGGADDRLGNRITEVAGTVRAISDMLVVMSARFDEAPARKTSSGNDTLADMAQQIVERSRTDQVENGDDDRTSDIDATATSEVDDSDSAPDNQDKNRPTQSSRSVDTAEIAILSQFPTVISVHMGNVGSASGDYD